MKTTNNPMMMKRFVSSAVFLMISVFVSISSLAKQTGYEQNAVVTISGLTLVSYTPTWNEEKLEALYDELLNNFTADELSYLGLISLYPDSPYGILGSYLPDFYVTENGKLAFGNQAEIELFQADKRSTVDSMANTLSHEYGHHFTIFHFTQFENKLYTQWENSQYATIRNLKNYPIIYDDTQTTNINTHRFDVTEIAANDYVQLFGSQTAKTFYDYPDALERLENVAQNQFVQSHSNLRPKKIFRYPWPPMWRACICIF